MSSIYRVSTNKTPDTLYVKTNATMGTGSKGSILVDNGTDVIQYPPGTNAYIVTMDSSTPSGINYLPYSVISSNIMVPVIGGITVVLPASGTTTVYSQFNVRPAMQSRGTLDYYNIPFNCTIHAIELIILPNVSNFIWPTFANNTKYFAFSMGYESGGVFTQFSPNANPHFTVSQAITPIAGVPNFNRSATYSVVRYVPGDYGITWTVTAGMNISLSLLNTVTGSGTYYITPTIYVKGSFT